MTDGFLPFTLLIFAVVGGMIWLVPRMSRGHQTDSEQTRLEVRRLYFAGGAIAALGLVFLEAMGMYYYGCPSMGCDTGKDIPGKHIFEACVQVIPPLITLILGYYFGKADGRSKPDHMNGNSGKSHTVGKNE